MKGRHWRAGSKSPDSTQEEPQLALSCWFGVRSRVLIGSAGVLCRFLVRPGDKVTYIPYRDSKLTRLLQPSLGGNARITIICTVTAALMSVDETNNTLKFANRAKRIKNHAAINEVSNEKVMLAGEGPGPRSLWAVAHRAVVHRALAVDFSDGFNMLRGLFGSLGCRWQAG